MFSTGPVPGPTEGGSLEHYRPLYRVRNITTDGVMRRPRDREEKAMHPPKKMEVLKERLLWALKYK